MNEKDFKNLNFTVIGKNSHLDGDLKFIGDTLINGRVTGILTIEEKAKLILEREGSFEGTLFCHDVEVFGDVKGTINASGTLCIRSGASVSGIVNANKLSVFPGAILNMNGHTTEENQR